MDSLPDELLVEIFAHLPSWELFVVQRVCSRWKLVVDDLFWKRTTQLTEYDLCPHSPVAIQIDNFAHLIGQMQSIQSFCFSFKESIRADDEVRLEKALCRVLAHERRCVHLGAMCFQLGMKRRQLKTSGVATSDFSLAANISFLDAIPELKLDAVQSIVIPKMTLGPFQGAEYNEILLEMVSSDHCQPREVVIQRLVVRAEKEWKCDVSDLMTSDGERGSSSEEGEEEVGRQEEARNWNENDDSWNEYSPRDDSNSGSCGCPSVHSRGKTTPVQGIVMQMISRLKSKAQRTVIRVNSVAFAFWLDEELVLHLRKELFSLDEFEDAVRSLGSFVLEENGANEAVDLLERWDESGRIRDASVFVSKIPVLINAASRTPSMEMENITMPIIRLCFPQRTSAMRVNTVDISELDELFSVLHEHGTLRRITDLEISLLEQACLGERGSFSSLPPRDEDPSQLWNHLTREDCLQRLKKLKISCMGITSRFAKELALDGLVTTPLPHLESIEVRGPVILPCLISLLDRAIHLRRLVLHLAYDNPAEDERFVWVSNMLRAVSLKTSLFSFELKLYKHNYAASTQWLEPWHVLVRREKLFHGIRYSTFEANVSEVVCNTFKSMKQLQSLKLDFNLKEFGDRVNLFDSVTRTSMSESKVALSKASALNANNQFSALVGPLKCYEFKDFEFCENEEEANLA